MLIFFAHTLQPAFKLRTVAGWSLVILAGSINLVEEVDELFEVDFIA